MLKRNYILITNHFSDPFPQATSSHEMYIRQKEKAKMKHLKLKKKRSQGKNYASFSSESDEDRRRPTKHSGETNKKRKKSLSRIFYSFFSSDSDNKASKSGGKGKGSPLRRSKEDRRRSSKDRSNKKAEPIYSKLNNDKLLRNSSLKTVTQSHCNCEHPSISDTRGDANDPRYSPSIFSPGSPKVYDCGGIYEPVSTRPNTNDDTTPQPSPGSGNRRLCTQEKHLAASRIINIKKRGSPSSSADESLNSGVCSCSSTGSTGSEMLVGCCGPSKTVKKGCVKSAHGNQVIGKAGQYEVSIAKEPAIFSPKVESVKPGKRKKRCGETKRDKRSRTEARPASNLSTSSDSRSSRTYFTGRAKRNGKMKRNSRGTKRRPRRVSVSVSHASCVSFCMCSDPAEVPIYTHYIENGVGGYARVNPGFESLENVNVVEDMPNNTIITSQAPVDALKPFNKITKPKGFNPKLSISTKIAPPLPPRTHKASSLVSHFGTVTVQCHNCNTLLKADDIIDGVASVMTIRPTGCCGVSGFYSSDENIQREYGAGKRLKRPLGIHVDHAALSIHSDLSLARPKLRRIKPGIISCFGGGYETVGESDNSLTVVSDMSDGEDVVKPFKLHHGADEISYCECEKTPSLGQCSYCMCGYSIEDPDNLKGAPSIVITGPSDGEGCKKSVVQCSGCSTPVKLVDYKSTDCGTDETGSTIKASPNKLVKPLEHHCEVHGFYPASSCLIRGSPRATRGQLSPGTKTSPGLTRSIHFAKGHSRVHSYVSFDLTASTAIFPDEAADTVSEVTLVHGSVWSHDRTSQCCSCAKPIPEHAPLLLNKHLAGSTPYPMEESKDHLGGIYNERVCTSCDGLLSSGSITIPTESVCGCPGGPVITPKAAPSTDIDKVCHVCEGYLTTDADVTEAESASVCECPAVPVLESVPVVADICVDPVPVAEDICTTCDGYLNTISSGVSESACQCPEVPAFRNAPVLAEVAVELVPVLEAVLAEAKMCEVCNGCLSSEPSLESQCFGFCSCAKHVEEPKVYNAIDPVEHPVIVPVYEFQPCITESNIREDTFTLTESTKESSRCCVQCNGALTSLTEPSSNEQSSSDICTNCAQSDLVQSSAQGSTQESSAQSSSQEESSSVSSSVTTSEDTTLDEAPADKSAVPVIENTVDLSGIISGSPKSPKKVDLELDEDVSVEGRQNFIPENPVSEIVSEDGKGFKDPAWLQENIASTGSEIDQPQHGPLNNYRRQNPNQSFHQRNRSMPQHHLQQFTTPRMNLNYQQRMHHLHQNQQMHAPNNFGMRQHGHPAMNQQQKYQGQQHPNLSPEESVQQHSSPLRQEKAVSQQKTASCQQVSESTESATWTSKIPPISRPNKPSQLKTASQPSVQSHISTSPGHVEPLGPPADEGEDIKPVTFLRNFADPVTWVPETPASVPTSENLMGTLDLQSMRVFGPPAERTEVEVKPVVEDKKRSDASNTDNITESPTEKNVESKIDYRPGSVSSKASSKKEDDSKSCCSPAPNKLILKSRTPVVSPTMENPCQMTETIRFIDKVFSQDVISDKMGSPDIPRIIETSNVSIFGCYALQEPDSFIDVSDPALQLIDKKPAEKEFSKLEVMWDLGYKTDVVERPIPKDTETDFVDRKPTRTPSTSAKQSHASSLGSHVTESLDTEVRAGSKASSVRTKGEDLETWDNTTSNKGHSSKCQRRGSRKGSTSSRSTLQKSKKCSCSCKHKRRPKGTNSALSNDNTLVSEPNSEKVEMVQHRSGVEMVLRQELSKNSDYALPSSTGNGTDNKADCTQFQKFDFIDLGDFDFEDTGMQYALYGFTTDGRYK